MNRRTPGRAAPRREGGIRSVKMQELNRDQEAARNRSAGGGLEWKRMDLHLHTPASSDYRDPGISYLDILKKAEEKNLDMIAFTDHNTVAGYAAMHSEIETLTLLERLGRMSDQERETLSEYRRLLAKINVLPGFEFTATFGFHVLGIFPENTSVRKLEYLLLNLNVPEEKMLLGAPDAGSTSDVLASYQAITAAGGLAIAAHANSSNGVAMQGFPFGGQTKIAYTQDSNLVALEVTDLEGTGRRNTASFYNGSKTEYPRRMHIIQGSDAHSLNTEQLDGMNKRLGVGARITEILVKEATFAALKELLQGTDFTRTRPFRQGMSWDDIDRARTAGQNMTQSFHERAFTHTSRTRPILHDIVAFSNAEGGTIYVGANPDKGVPIHGIERPDEAVRMLKDDLRRTIEPPVEPDFRTRGGPDRGVVIVTVPKGDEAPYAFTPTGQIYIRVEGESVVANRDEIVTLVLEANRSGMARVSSQPAQAAPQLSAPQPRVAQPASDAGEPMSPAQFTGKAVPAPAQPQTLAQPPRREERREQPQQPAARLPQETRTQRQPPLPAPSPPQPPADRTARPPVFANLPPEKLKGQVRPMTPVGATPQAEPPAPEPAPITTMPAEETAAAQVEVELEQPTSLETPPPAEPAPSPARRGRSRGGRKGAEALEAQAAQEPSIETPATPDVTPAEMAQAEAQPETRKPSRSRRKAADVEEAAPEQAEAPASGETEMPTEMTVSAEHLTREELVEAAPEQPAKGRGRPRKRDKKLEVDAPTAAATETEAAEVAILVAAEVQPGAQLPGELPTEATEPEMTSPAPPSRKRGRGKSVAQQAAEAEVQTETPQSEQTSTVEEQPVPAEEAPKKGRGRARKGAEEPPAAQPQAVPQPQQTAAQQSAAQSSAIRNPQSASPAPPSTGVEIISTEERNNMLYHTMRDLRNPASVVHNVTRKSARRLWLYAIMQHEHGDPTAAEIAWHPSAPLGLWRREHRAGASRYDLAARYPDGSLRIFYGVTDEGLVGQWRELVRLAEDADYWGPPPIEK
jgi:hypothetical protein